MKTIYTTRDGDTVDFIAWKYYGHTTNKLTEAVLLANPGLADYGPSLPSGLEVILPDADSPGKTEGVRLWD